MDRTMRRACLVLFLFAFQARAVTYTVDTTNDFGVGSLRWAIEQANTSTVKDVIAFDIFPPNVLATIQPTGALPMVTQPLDIDGTTQTKVDCPPGVQLSGTLTLGAYGLVVSNTRNCDIHGLVINAWNAGGIRIISCTNISVYGNYIGTDTNGAASFGVQSYGVSLSTASSNNIGLAPLTCTNRNIISGHLLTGVRIASASAYNRLVNNYIGTDVDGLIAVPNGEDGLNVSSRDNEIGIASSVKPVNLISGNRSNGMAIATVSATGNRILGNYIGTTVGGGAALGNGGHGIQMFYCQSDEIGGSGSEGRNTISANGKHGVDIRTNCTGHILEGNYIGTDAQGLYSLGNSNDGVHVTEMASQIVIGGRGANERNVISGNQGSGISIDDRASGNFVFGNYIGLDSNGDLAVTNQKHGIQIVNEAGGNFIGETLTNRSNVIAGNGMHGLFIDQSGFNLITGNRIGLNANNQAVGNGRDGIRLQNAWTNYIGGASGAHGNVISGNRDSGIQIGSNAPGNEVVGCYIGTDTNGLLARPNGNEGVFIFNSKGNRIGKSGYPVNVIAANEGSGVMISESPLASDNTVVESKIGTDRTGNMRLGNGDHGVYINESPSNQIGDPAARNIISGNNWDGVRIQGSNAVGNMLWNNFIGTDQAGLAPVSNDWRGVHLIDAVGTIVGGTNNLGNLISGNWYGLVIEGAAAQRNMVFGNKIGTDATGGSKLPNDWHGVEVQDDARWNSIGSINTQNANIIAFNGWHGVYIEAATNNAVVGNAIFSNGMYGIKLDGGTLKLNDDQDPDVGANMLQNFPVLYSATTGTILGALRVSGTLNSIPNSEYRLEFFLNDAAGFNGNGEGQKHLGYRTMTTDAAGNTNFYSFVFLGTDAQAGQYVTATCTDTNWNTSAFSYAVEIVETNLFDADGDGMPGAWEGPRGLDPEDATGTNGAAGDPDVDLTGNYDEYVADTDPKDAGNYFHLVAITNPADTVVAYSSTNSRYYMAGFLTNDLSHPAWVNLYPAPVQGSNDLTSAEDTNHTPTRIYRVSVQLTP